MIKKLLKEHLSKEVYAVWEELDSKTPDIWSLPTSSSGKYHQKEDGSVPTNEEHTYEMLNAFVKIKSAFRKSEREVILMAIVLHDCLKYGHEVGRHTVRDHDLLAAEFTREHEERLLTVFEDDQINVLAEAVLMHSGRWSSLFTSDREFSFYDYPKEVLIVHMLDMMSTANVLK